MFLAGNAPDNTYVSSDSFLMCNILWIFYFIFILQFIFTIITENFEDFDMSSLTFIHKHFIYT